jgi:hypothetical protein
VSTTEPNRLMLCGETVAVCCENLTEQTDTVWAVRISQETQIHCVGRVQNLELLLLCSDVGFGFEGWFVILTDNRCCSNDWFVAPRVPCLRSLRPLHPN